MKRTIFIILSMMNALSHMDLHSEAITTMTTVPYVVVSTPGGGEQNPGSPIVENMTDTVGITVTADKVSAISNPYRVFPNGTYAITVNPGLSLINSIQFKPEGNSNFISLANGSARSDSGTIRVVIRQISDIVNGTLHWNSVSPLLTIDISVIIDTNPPSIALDAVQIIRIDRPAGQTTDPITSVPISYSLTDDNIQSGMKESTFVLTKAGSIPGDSVKIPGTQLAGTPPVAVSRTAEAQGVGHFLLCRKGLVSAMACSL